MTELRVIIAEDEPPVARFVGRIVEQGKDTVCAVCQNGNEVLEVLAQSTADVLITDIRMPGISGLELIAQAREKCPGLQFIIISSYKNFEYAKEAIALGVENYIAKPIDCAELGKTLQRVRKRMEEEQRKKWRRSLEYSVRRKDRKLFLELSDWTYCSMLFLYRSGGTPWAAGVEEKLGEQQAAFLYENALVVLADGSDQKRQEEGLLRLARLLMREAQENGTCTCLQIRQADLRRDPFGMIRDGIRRLRKCTVLGKRRLLQSDTLTEESSEETHCDGVLVRKLCDAIYRKDREGIQKAARKLVWCWKTEEASVYYICGQLYTLVENMVRGRGMADDAVHARETAWELLQESDDFDGLFTGLLALIQQWEREQGQPRHRASGETMQLYVKICSFLEQNESRSFSLQEISRIFHISQPYANKIFRQFSGLTYKEYVLSQKMELAKRLMQEEPEILVKEVAERIGLEQLYFSTVFRKYAGMTPTQYRAEAVTGDRRE